MTKQEEFEKKKSELSDKSLYEVADAELSLLCTTHGKSFNMSIPPRTSDTDMIFAELLKRFKNLTTKQND